MGDTKRLIAKLIVFLGTIWTKELCQGNSEKQLKNGRKYIIAVKNIWTGKNFTKKSTVSQKSNAVILEYNNNLGWLKSKIKIVVPKNKIFA